MMTQSPPNGTAAAALLKDRDKVAQATDVIDRDPEEAAARLQPILKASPTVGDITVQDMFGLMSQLMAQQATMQQQIVELMTGQASGGNGGRKAPDTQEELAKDKLQRDLTLRAWHDEPREPVWIQPDQDEDKVFAVMGQYPPRLFRVNGLEFPITPGQINNVPSSIARLVEHNQKRRPYSGPPQGLGQIADPQRAQFLASSQSVEIGRPGRAGDGRVVPDGLPPHPQELGLRYDQNGQ
jgi:hypothetical protein